MAAITFDNAGKVYPGGARALAGFSLDIGSGEFIVFVGPSGCGKTTALRMVCGLETVTEGTISIDGRVVNDVPPKDRDIAMVFQTYALYPHMTVADNLAFGLKLRKTDRAETRRRVEHAARLLGLTDLLDRKPRQLSGGQRQRVAMGRAIVREPKAFLMDEPLSNLDAKLRVQMRAEIAALQQDLKTTTIYVTHDQTEAMTMGDRVAVIRKGELQQVAPPQELYDDPVNLFVGGFIGSPAMNMLLGVVRRDGDGITLALGDASIGVDDPALAKALQPYADEEVVVGLRPEHLRHGADAPPDQPRISGVLRLREPLGAEVIAHVDIAARPAATQDVRELAADLGAEEEVERRAGSDTATLVARFDPDSRVAVGDRVEVAVDQRRIYVFDVTTGESIRKRGDP